MEWHTERPLWLPVAGKRLEARCWGPPPQAAPTIVMLHEGLGSVAGWKDFPERLMQTTGCGILAYSRFGYGQSDPVTLPRPLDYMTCEAVDVLPRVLDQIGFEHGILLGHSDGASIAAIHAGSIEDPRIAGLVLMAPHFFTEPPGLASIAEAKAQYETTDLRVRLAKYHRDVDNAFHGWNQAWLDPGFRNWNIAGVIDNWRVPVLAIQGAGDQYGTLAQIHEIERRIRFPLDVVVLPDCRHAPHLEQQAQTLAAIKSFTARLHAIDEAAVEAACLPLPDTAWIPGKRARPHSAVLDHVVGAVPAQPASGPVAPSLPWHYGIRLIEEGFYWEAHEVLEAVWTALAPNSRERFLAQTMIHIANAALKQKMGNRRASRRISALARESCARAYDGCDADVLGLSRQEVGDHLARYAPDSVNEL